MMPKSTGKAPRARATKFDLEAFEAWKAEPGDNPKEWSRKKKLLFDRLVVANLPFVKVQVAKLHRRSSVPSEIEDLEQAGALGVMRALETYNPAKGAFTTYAAWWIKYEVQKAQKVTLAVGRPEHSGMPYKAFLAAETIRALHGREPTPEEWAELGVSQKDLDKWAQGPVVISMSEDWRGRDHGLSSRGVDNDHGAALGDTLTDGKGTSEDLLSEAIDEDTLERLLPTLPPREREVLEGIYYEDKSIDDLATKFGVTKCWIHELRASALKRLRKGLEAS